MLLDLLKDIPVVLGSQSPRRKDLLDKMGIQSKVIVKETDESFDEHLAPAAIVAHIAFQKLKAFDPVAFADSLVITADTIVLHAGNILGKPQNKEEALATLRTLQGRSHQVLTAVALQYKEKQYSFVEVTEVHFAALSDAELRYYVDKFMPLDKAGSYGIQEWIGWIGVSSINGSYENVIGLPTARLYQELKAIFV